jgi:hypothetical protein
VSRRADSIRVVARWLARGGLLALWALVGWGTLLVLVTLANVASQGPRVAISRLVPGPGASIWSLISFLSVSLALVAWMVVAGLAIAARRPAGSDEAKPPGSDEAPPANEPGPAALGSSDER